MMNPVPWLQMTNMISYQGLVRTFPKAKAKLLDVKHWLALKALLETAQTLMADIGSIEFDDFNSFKTQVDKSLKAHAIKLSAPEKNAILHAVSWYDETAKKVVKKVVKLTGDKLNDLLSAMSVKSLTCQILVITPFLQQKAVKKASISLTRPIQTCEIQNLFH